MSKRKKCFLCHEKIKKNDFFLTMQVHCKGTVVGDFHICDDCYNEKMGG